jgi:hypothetical protein
MTVALRHERQRARLDREEAQAVIDAQRRRARRAALETAAAAAAAESAAAE